MAHTKKAGTNMPREKYQLAHCIQSTNRNMKFPTAHRNRAADRPNKLKRGGQFETFPKPLSPTLERIYVNEILEAKNIFYIP